MIVEVCNILRESGVEYSEDGKWIWVSPNHSDGFDVGFAEDENRAYVSCSGWHEEFEEKEEAKNCFLNALTPRVRILVTSRGAFEHKWEYQAFEDDNWQSYGVTGLLVAPFWRKSEQKIKTNRVLQ